MNKNRNKLIILLVTLIFIGFLALTVLGYRDYSDVIKKDIENITKLVSTNIYSEIQIELIKPIFVSLTMANDSFVKEWVEKDSEQNIDAITQYLQGIQDKYSYDSTFFVSNITKNYYHYDGILKKVSPDDPHDIWFYDFLEKKSDYDLVVDTDQASGDVLTLFVNCVVKDGEDVLGVTGVGVKMSKIQSIIRQYQDEFGVEIFLMSPDGTIQIHADENIIGRQNAFNDVALNGLKNDILTAESALKVFEPQKDDENHYIVSYYIQELDWYLIVHKDAQILDKLLFTQRVKSAIIFCISFFFVALLTIYIATYYHNKNLKFIKTDYLTDINNRSAFDEALNVSISRARNYGNPFTLAVIDIDDFKIINDMHGHVEGDNILKGVAEYLKSFIRTDDIIARWGGDEFAIIFSCDSKSAHKILDRLILYGGKNNILMQYGITFSIGISQYSSGDTPQSLLDRADKALYTAKTRGKNQVFSL